MKTLNDFKNENNDLTKLEMAQKMGGLTAPPEITVAADSNWNCGDTKVCKEVAEVGGGTVTVCTTTSLPNGD
jgi:hypothetical protein